MTDETMADALEQDAPAIEAEQPTPEADETTDINAGSEEAEGTEEGTEGQEEPAEELDVIELDGKQYQVPKALKAGFMMNADYTRKTQEVAAHRRELEQREQTIAQQAQATEEELDLRAGLRALSAELQQYANVDWQKLEAEDLIAAQGHWRRYTQLKEAVQNATTELDRKASERTEKVQQDTAKRLQETLEFAKTKIPGWNNELDAKITDFATSELGFSRDMLLGAYNPQIYRALHLAWLGFQAMKKPAAAAKPANTSIKPTATVTARANPKVSKSPSEMSMDEYVAWRTRKSG